jgi:hypothetical protein
VEQTGNEIPTITITSSNQERDATSCHHAVDRFCPNVHIHDPTIFSTTTEDINTTYNVGINHDE